MSSHFPSISQPFIAPLSPSQGGLPQGVPSLFTPGTLPHDMPGTQLGGDLVDPGLTASTTVFHMALVVPDGFPLVPTGDGTAPVAQGTKRARDGEGYTPPSEYSTPKGPRMSLSGSTVRASSSPMTGDAALQWALRESLDATKATASPARPKTEALCGQMERPKWDAPLKGKAIARKDGEGHAQDLRHVVAYETMQSSVQAVLRISKTDSQNYETLDRLASAMGDGVPAIKDDHLRGLTTAAKLNDFLFVCKGNFFLGDALENQRAGSSTAALHHTESRRVLEVNAATDERGIAAVLGQATKSLSGPVLDTTLQAYGLPALGPRPAAKPGEDPKQVDKAYDAAKKTAQETLADRMLTSLPLLAFYQAETDATSKGIYLTLLKSDVGDLIEGLADSTAYDVSRTAHAGLGDKQKSLNVAFGLFRAAERTGNVDSLVEAVTIMKKIDTDARDMAPEVPTRKGAKTLKPSFESLYQQAQVDAQATAKADQTEG